MEIDDETRQKFDALTDLFPQEELCDELACYLETNEESGYQMIRHPLVYSMFHSPYHNGFVNKQLRGKQKAVQQAFKDKEWNSFIWLHERPYRITALHRIIEHISDKKYWELVGDVWIDSENIRQHPEDWEQLLGNKRGSRKHIMTPGEQADLATLPSKFKVYQGHTDERDDGWSWTTRLDTAWWFARRFAKLEGGQPMLSVGMVYRKDALAYFTRRNEFEILVSPKNVRKRTILGATEVEDETGLLKEGL